MGVSTSQKIVRLMAAVAMVLVTGCGSESNGGDEPDTVVWISFQTNLSSVSVDITVTSSHNTQTFTMPPGSNSQTNQIIAEVGDNIQFRVIGPGGTTTVTCQATSLIVGDEANPPHSVFGELNVDADNSTTVVACGNNWA